VRNRHDEPRPQFDVQPDHGSAVIAQATIWRALEVLPPRRLRLSSCMSWTVSPCR
jgi:hypothetical protein